jgi:hypothetical protein
VTVDLARAQQEIRKKRDEQAARRDRSSRSGWDDEGLPHADGWVEALEWVLGLLGGESECIECRSEPAVHGGRGALCRGRSML